MWFLKMLLFGSFLGMMFEGDGSDVIAGAEGQSGDSEKPAESSTETAEGEAEPGEGVKTQEKESEPSDEDVEAKLLKDGAAIPYDRFKTLIDKRNAGFKERDEKFSKVQKDLEESKGYLDKPKVFRAILEERGLTKEKITEEMKRAGFTQKEEVPQNELFKQLSQGVDLTTQDGWFSVMSKMAQHYSKGAIEPISQKLSESERNVYIRQQEEEARTLAKDVYKLDFGKARQDENNPATGIGKIWNYLEKNPSHAGLGHVALLKLAMAEEGFAIAKDKGVQQEKDRLKALKDSQMEGDGFVGKKGVPSADEPLSVVTAYAEKNIT